MQDQRALLHYETGHFKGTRYVDLTLVPFESAHEIATLFTTNFTNWKERNFLSNARLWPVFSKQLVELIKKHEPALVHYPATIIDTKGAEVRGEFLVVQIPGVEGLVDLDASVVQRDTMFPEIFASITKLEFKRGTTPPALFRLSEYAQVILVNAALRDELINANLSGLTVTGAEKYDWNSL